MRPINANLLIDVLLIRVYTRGDLLPKRAENRKAEATSLRQAILDGRFRMKRIGDTLIQRNEMKNRA